MIFLVQTWNPQTKWRYSYEDVNCTVVVQKQSLIWNRRKRADTSRWCQRAFQLFVSQLISTRMYSAILLLHKILLVGLIRFQFYLIKWLKRERTFQQAKPIQNEANAKCGYGSRISGKWPFVARFMNILSQDLFCAECVSTHAAMLAQTCR